jgi:protein TonB
MHLLGALALLQAGRTVLAQQRPAPIQVRVLDVQAPAPQAPAPPAKVQLPHQLLPLTQTPQPLPLPEFEMVAPATRVLPAPAQAAPAQSPAPITASTIEATQSAAPAPQPKAVASSALRYRVEPAVELPLLSRRAGEQGRVGLRVVFDTQGRPRDIQLQRSSGFARLDAQALVAMQAARIQPYQEAGRTIEVLALAWLEYELD